MGWYNLQIEPYNQLEPPSSTSISSVTRLAILQAATRLGCVQAIAFLPGSANEDSKNRRICVVLPLPI